MSHSKIWQNQTNLTGAFPFLDELFDENGRSCFSLQNPPSNSRRQAKPTKEYAFNVQRIPIHLRGPMPGIRPEISAKGRSNSNYHIVAAQVKEDFSA